MLLNLLMWPVVGVLVLVCMVAAIFVLIATRHDWRHDLDHDQEW